MDQTLRYRYLRASEKLLGYANTGTTKGNVERQLIFDTEHDHYQLVNVGWENRNRVYGCVLHFDIKDGKIWLQYNGTEIDFATELVRLGIPQQDIVIGFHSTWMRQFTEYAVS